MKKFLFLVFVMLALPFMANASPLDNWERLLPEPGASTAGEQVTATAFGKTADYAAGVIVAVGYTGAVTETVGVTAPGERSIIRTSEDGGYTWTRRHNGPDNSRLNAVTFGGGRFVAVGTGGDNDTGLDLILTSVDGFYWTRVFPSRPSSYEPGLALAGVAYGADSRTTGVYVAVGSDASGTNVGSLVYRSVNGVNWTRETIIADAVNLRAVIGAFGPHFVAVGDDTFGNGRIYTSGNGITWTERARTDLVTYPLATIAYGDGLYVAGGDRFSTNSQTYFTSRDSANWYPQTNLVSYGMYGIDGIKFGNIGNPADTADVPGFVVASASVITPTPGLGQIWSGVRPSYPLADDPGGLIFGPLPRLTVVGADFDGVGYADGAFLGLGAYTPAPAAVNAIGEYAVIFGSDFPIPDVPTLFVCQPFIGTGTGTVKSSSGGGYPGPGGINCGDVGPGETSVCSYRFLQFTQVVLTAAATSENFIEWTGACTGTSPVCLVDMDRTQNVCATFGLDQYTVNPRVVGNGNIYRPVGSVTVATPWLVGYLTSTSFDVVPAPNHHIVSVTGDTCVVTPESFNENQRVTYNTDLIDDNCTVTATFEVNKYRVAINWTGRGVVRPPSGGSSNPGFQEIVAGAQAVFTLTPGTAFGLPFPYDGFDYFIDRVRIENATPSGSKVWPVGFNCTGVLTGTDHTVNTYTTGAIFPPTPVPGTPWDMDNNTTVCTISVDFDRMEAFHVYPVVLNSLLVPGGNGKISPNTEQVVLGGDWKEFTITPDAGYTWYFLEGPYEGRGGCQGTLTGNVFRTRVTSDCAVAVVFVEEAESFVVTPVAGANGSINPSTPQTVNKGASATFTVAPNLGYHISSVSGCSGSLFGDTFVTGPITAACTVSASFAVDSFAVTPVAGPNGSISPNTVQQVAYGSTASFTVTPNAGYIINAVTGCNGTLVGNTYTTGAITAACAVSATFTKESFAVTPVAGPNGSISPNTVQQVAFQGTAVFTVTPNAGYKINTVTGCGGTLVGNAFTTAPITAACTVSASFAVDSFAVTPVAGPNGSISPNTVQQVAFGATTSFTVTPNAGYNIDAVTGCNGTLVGNTYTTGPIVAACAVSATFERIYVTVSPAAGPNGFINPNTPQQVAYGATTSFSVIPNALYKIDAVTGCNGTLVGNTYTTGAVTTACAVNATFTPSVATVTPVAGSNGSISPNTPQQIALGTTASFAVIPNAGFKINTVTGCGGTLVGNTYTTAPITAACTVNATFTSICTYVITPATKIFPAKWWGLTANIAVVASGLSSCPAPTVTVVEGADWLSASLQSWNQYSWSNNKGTVQAIATANTTGMSRNGAVVIGDKVWTATQAN